MGLVESLQRQPTPMVLTATLSLVGQSRTLRCDAKQAERRFSVFDDYVQSVPSFLLDAYLPHPIVKGSQPVYLEHPDADGTPVINTMAIQDMAIDQAACRLISHEDFEKLAPEKKPRAGDVLLTMDGGPSIGKPVVFRLEDEFAIDSHVAILRPEGIEPDVLAYLLASPLGQVQFARAESGASGQTAVTEEDLREFRFPEVKAEELLRLSAALGKKLTETDERRVALNRERSAAWETFTEGVLGAAGG